MRRATNLDNVGPMQRKLHWVIGVAMGFDLGCGGAAVANAPSSPSAGPAPVDGAAASAAPAPAEPTSTTTALGDAGSGGPATKLVPETTPSAGGGAPPVPKGHTHDPGRGTNDIRAIVVGHRDEARACYDRALADHPGLEGDLVVTWTIDPKGGVTQAALDQARSKITEPSVVGCIIAIIQKLQFAASPGGFETRTSYPFNFHPHHAKTP
jgi:hypothetical protein